eukprot:m51a1_g5996 putative peptidase m4 (797) ;mRNA; f:293924-296988
MDTTDTTDTEHCEPCICSIIPPYVLEGMASSTALSAETRAAAQQSLATTQALMSARISAQTGIAAFAARRAAMSAPGPAPTGSMAPRRTVYDAVNTNTLPGVPAQMEPVPSDRAVAMCLDGLGDTFDLYHKVFQRNSIDDCGMNLDGTVHYGNKYNNAFWNGNQMVFGDGDGEVFMNFTQSLDVIGHELAHGVTSYTAALVYSGQSGALNESVSDVFGSLVKQFKLKQMPNEADWLIGKDLMAPGFHGLALRSLKAPGTAYDDPRIGGKDPQPDHMDKYLDTPKDNGGVHTNSGIPNHAFYLLATALPCPAWEAPGKIWYAALCDKEMKRNASFKEFAESTVRQAKALFPKGLEADGHTVDVVGAVLSAWHKVGLLAEPQKPEEHPAPQKTFEERVQDAAAQWAEWQRKSLAPEGVVEATEPANGVLEILSSPGPDGTQFSFSLWGKIKISGSYTLMPPHWEGTIVPWILPTVAEIPFEQAYRQIRQTAAVPATAHFVAEADTEPATLAISDQDFSLKLLGGKLELKGWYSISPPGAEVQVVIFGGQPVAKASVGANRKPVRVQIGIDNVCVGLVEFSVIPGVAIIHAKVAANLLGKEIAWEGTLVPWTKILPAMLAIAPVAGDTYSHFTITNGYGLLAQASGEVTEGASMTLDVKFGIKAVTQQSFSDLLRRTTKMFTKEQNEQLEENHAAGGFMGGLLLGCFGFACGGGSYNHFKNYKNKEVTIQDEKQKEFLANVAQTATTDVTVAVYVQLTTVKIGDKTITAVDTNNAVAANAEGKTGGAKVTGEQLEIVPL